jgi:hypothetical protein
VAIPIHSGTARRRSQWILEPSFAAAAADALGLFVPPDRQGDWGDRRRASLPAGVVALKVNQLHHTASGVEWKTLANHKSNAKAALHWYRKDNELPLRGMPLAPEWQELRRLG